MTNFECLTLARCQTCQNTKHLTMGRELHNQKEQPCHGNVHGHSSNHEACTHIEPEEQSEETIVARSSEPPSTRNLLIPCKTTDIASCFAMADNVYQLRGDASMCGCACDASLAASCRDGEADTLPQTHDHFGVSL